MRILLLTPDMPYPSESGAALRNMGIIRGLSAAGHAITLLTFSSRPASSTANPLLTLCEDVCRVPLPHHSKLKRLAKLVSSDAADMEFRLMDAEFSRRLGEILSTRGFDVIQFSGIELGGYLGQILALKRGAKVVYDALNAEAELQRVIATVDLGQVRRFPFAFYSAIQSRRLTKFEARICRQVDSLVAVSDEDRRHLSAYAGAPIHVVPNGVSAEAYRAPPHNIRADGLLVFSGKMDYRPNMDAVEWFCGEVWPLVRAGHPDASLRIVGRSPHLRVQALASQDNLDVTGRVESIQPHLHAAAIYVVPLRMGSGTRLKILQAMAAGCAVVSTSIGAAGMNEEARASLEIADGASEFARAINALLDDSSKRWRLGESARETVRRHYDWPVLIPRLMLAYEALGLG